LTEQEKSHLLILDAGSGEGTSIKIHEIGQDFDYTLVRADINPDDDPDYLWDITEEPPEDLLDRFDIVIANHVLEHLVRTSVPRAIWHLRNCLRDGGELRIAVPSMEWCAQQILNPNGANPVILPVLFGEQEGDQYQGHKCGFTLDWLRALIQEAKMIPRRANQGIFHIIYGEEEFLAVENIVVAVRHKEFEHVAADPSSALE